MYLISCDMHIPTACFPLHPIPDKLLPVVVVAVVLSTLCTAVFPPSLESFDDAFEISLPLPLPYPEHVPVGYAIHQAGGHSTRIPAVRAEFKTEDSLFFFQS